MPCIKKINKSQQINFLIKTNEEILSIYNLCPISGLCILFEFLTFVLLCCVAWHAI